MYYVLSLEIICTMSQKSIHKSNKKKWKDIFNIYVKGFKKFLINLYKEILNEYSILIVCIR